MPQLSAVYGTGTVTNSLQVVEVEDTAIFDGQLIVGACMSVTTTVWLHVAVLPAASVAVHITVVLPTG